LLSNRGGWTFPLYLLATLFLAGAACWLIIDPRRPVFEPSADRQ
jgi:hypothetical protein